MELDFYGNVISDEGVKAIASSPYMAKLKKLNLYGNLVEDEGAIAIAESETLSKLKFLFLTANRVRRKGIETLKKARSRLRLSHLYLDDIEEFAYEEVDDEDEISSWDDLEKIKNEIGDEDED